MRGFSKAIITGNLTRDPEMRSTSTGTGVCSFSVAVNRTYRDASGNQKEEVSFFDCSAWGKTGETVAKYAKKGTGILVSGRLAQRTWEDKSGNKRSSVEIVVEDFNFLGSGNKDSEPSNYGGGYSSASEPKSSSPITSAVTPDDIPEGEIDLSEVPF